MMHGRKPNIEGSRQNSKHCWHSVLHLPLLLHQHNVQILTRRERRKSAWQRTMTLGPPPHLILGLIQRTIISVFDVVKQDIRQRSAKIRPYAPFRLLPLLHWTGFDRIWKNGQMLEGREDRPGASM